MPVAAGPEDLRAPGFHEGDEAGVRGLAGTAVEPGSAPGGSGAGAGLGRRPAGWPANRRVRFTTPTGRARPPVTRPHLHDGRPSHVFDVGSRHFHSRPPLPATRSEGATELEQNQPPRPVGRIPNQELVEGDTVSGVLTWYFDDPDDDPLTFTAESTAEAVSVLISGSKLDVIGVMPGTARVVVTATDPGDLTASQNFPRDGETEATGPQCRVTISASTPVQQTTTSFTGRRPLPGWWSSGR